MELFSYRVVVLITIKKHILPIPKKHQRVK